MDQWEIHDAEIQWRNCPDRRPWLIIEVCNHGVCGCFPISGQDYNPRHFELRIDDPDFAATGLAKTCYVYDEHIIEIRVDQFKRRRGQLEGNLLTRFRDYAGL